MNESPRTVAVGRERARIARTVRPGSALLVFAASFSYFLLYFEHIRWQPTVDVAWLVATLAWTFAFWRADTPTLPRLQHPWWFYALYVAALVPFGTDWRWVMAGDNLGWPFGGIYVAEHGPSQSLLSANGADNFGYLQMNLHNIFMTFVEPTIFWHRVGKVVVGVCAVASVYTVFARLVSRPFGLLVAGCAASCSIWIVYTYASVPFIDGIASGYALLAVGLWVRRDPASRRAWLVLGLLSGFMLFLTPNGWFMAVCVWSWLGLATLRYRWRLSLGLLAVLTMVIVGCPMLIQWSQGTGGQLFSLVQNPGWTVDKVLRFSGEAAFIPFSSQVDNSGAFGPQLPWGFRWLFIPGILLTPLFASRFPGARFILWIYAVHVVILTFSQGPYAGVSVKRALVLIPMAAYFVFLPAHRYLRSYAVVLPLMALWASFGIYDVVTQFKPGRTGYTLLDGAVEAHQRFAPSTVCAFLPNDGRALDLKPGGELDRLYGLTPRLKLVEDVHDPACQQVLCYCSQPACAQADLHALGYEEVPLLNSVELRCGRRRAEETGADGSR